MASSDDTVEDPPPPSLGRRDVLAAGAGTLLALGLGAPDATADAGLDVLRDAMALGRRLRAGQLTPEAWQDDIGRVLSRTSVTELARAVQMDAARRRAPHVRQGASIVQVPVFDALDADEGADCKLFFFEPGRTDPPHVHFNMVAAHLVLEGTVRVRHFARVAERDGGFVIRPTHDRTIGPGQITTISDRRDNGHWHAAVSRAVLLDVQQGRLDGSLPVRRREMVDYDRARDLGDGTLFVHHIPRREALRRYG